MMNRRDIPNGTNLSKRQPTETMSKKHKNKGKDKNRNKGQDQAKSTVAENLDGAEPRS